MRFGAMNFPVVPILREIEAFAGMGFDYLELAMDPPGAHYTTVRHDRSLIRRSLEDHAMGLVCHLPTFVSTADLTESIRKASVEETLRSLETAADLGAEKTVLHPGHIRGMGAFVRETAIAFAVESLDVLTESARRLAMPLFLENMFPGYGAFFEPDEFASLFARYPLVGMTLDTGHAHIDSPGGHRIFDFIARLGSRIGHVHVSDNSGQGDEHLPIGKGTIDFPAVVSALTRAGYDGTVTMEIFSDDRRQLVASRKAVAAMFAEREPASDSP